MKLPRSFKYQRLIAARWDAKDRHVRSESGFCGSVKRHRVMIGLGGYLVSLLISRMLIKLLGWFSGAYNEKYGLGYIVCPRDEL